MHGSNWAARNEAVELWKIDNVSELSVGDTVLKAYEPGENGYNLPERYANDPDQRDYYHAGVVVSVNPLRIVHMTSPTAKTDKTLGRWRFAFLWRQLSTEEADTIKQEEIPMNTLYQAVVSTKEDPLTLRNAPGGDKIGKLPRGATVDVLVVIEDWAYVRYNGMSGYASMKYLEPCEPEGEDESIHLCLVFTDSAGNTWIPVGDFSATLKVVND